MNLIDVTEERVHALAIFKTRELLSPIPWRQYPAPSPLTDGKRSVDSYDIRELIREGQNRLDVLVLSIGVGTATYCLGKAGLIFEY